MKFSAVLAAASAGLVSAAANATVTEVGVVTANKTVQVTITSCKDDVCHEATASPTPAVIVPVPVANGTTNGTVAGNHTKPEPSQAEGTSVILANGASALGLSGVAAVVAGAALLL
ncbi:hypothetical protein CJU90_0090 [Yarrowia sp. C11]|nr:hypothetical protein CKK34_1501 [Yarrowia sp. E02]KAG5372450.1 hypothetical protein CJU90_0090 [Yarrowia sp. C11]